MVLEAEDGGDHVEQQPCSHHHQQEAQVEGDLADIKHAQFLRDEVLPAMESVRITADELEKIVADDLWPLPHYSEMLFIK